MIDEPPYPPDELDLENLLPFEDPNPGRPRRRRRPVPRSPFLYLGDSYTAGEFTEFVRDYDFGTVPPDFVVLHHTAIPCTLHTRQPKGDIWDGREEGLSEAQIRARRGRKLDGLRNHYRDTLGWDRGPHLYIDDRYIWHFSPMRDVGIHSMWGNAFRDADGYHYSIGIEVIGHYEAKPWPPEVARLVGHAVAVLKRRLGTFELRYQYPNGNPGRKSAGRDRNGNIIWKCARPQLLRAGAISSHRD